MKLYKFRSLGNDKDDLNRAREILSTRKFWCSQFWELNDPMEGVYSFIRGALSEAAAAALFERKTRSVICSFSGKRALGNPLLWGYYANGFKGFAVEVDVGPRPAQITRVTYDKTLPCIARDCSPDDAVAQVLTTKLDCWSHEIEYRFLTEAERGNHQIGKITAVYFGKPYGGIDNAAEVQALQEVREYFERAERLTQTAKDQGITCHWAEVVDGRVVTQPMLEGR